MRFAFAQKDLMLRPKTKKNGIPLPRLCHHLADGNESSDSGKNPHDLDSNTNRELVHVYEKALDST